MSKKNVENLENVLNGVLTVLDEYEVWTGTMTDLNKELVRNLGRQVKLPKSPSALRVALNRVVNRLRSRGISVKFGRTEFMRYVKFTA